MYKHKISLSGSGFWVVESLPYRGEDAVNVFSSYDHGMLECSRRNLAVAKDNGTAGERMTWNGKPSGTYENHYISEIRRLEEKLAGAPLKHA